MLSLLEMSLGGGFGVGVVLPNSCGGESGNLDEALLDGGEERGDGRRSYCGVTECHELGDVVVSDDVECDGDAVDEGLLDLEGGSDGGRGIGDVQRPEALQRGRDVGFVP